MQQYKDLQEQYDQLLAEKEEYEAITQQLKEALRECIQENDNVFNSLISFIFNRSANQHKK